MKINTTKNKSLIKKIAQKYQLRLILLFGSQTGDQKYLHQESDFDIAYLSRRNLDLMEEGKLINDLIQVFKSERIDLVNLKKAKPLLLFLITNDCQVLYQDNAFTFPSLRVYAYKKYIETRFLYEEKFRRLEEKIKQIKIK